MRLVTHNLLMCNRKGCTIEHYPLAVEPKKLEVRATEFKPEFVRHLLPKLEWKAVVSAGAQCGQSVPPEMPADASTNEAFLKALHDILLDLHVEEGDLVCSHCGRHYPIKDGIPNMLLNDDEL